MIRSMLYVFDKVREVTIKSYDAISVRENSNSLDINSVSRVHNLILIEDIPNSLKMETVIRRFPNIKKLVINKFKGDRRVCLRWNTVLKKLKIEHLQSDIS